jgi:hypothetical protein
VNYRLIFGNYRFPGGGTGISGGRAPSERYGAGRVSLLRSWFFQVSDEGVIFSDGGRFVHRFSGGHVWGDLVRGYSGARGFQGRPEKPVKTFEIIIRAGNFLQNFFLFFSKIAMHAAAPGGRPRGGSMTVHFWMWVSE